ncbi:class I SAM-dependent methyltransferase [Lipingzhangella sp. LS1_29]|uniref:Class I SAM-dependent methyltransferase n=1 Tax=Lipingzhangella rawalii TaxID=2055835 RepID=A0ABU2HB63_9ACTN|nr:class I SAM-dependent methyltransferase [Lipingzhangella rawalii]MDS1272521.1 class I SAM-dependent methyltransferase [Lipingzhangella rawalii]
MNDNATAASGAGAGYREGEVDADESTVTESPAHTTDQVRQRHAANRVAWDEAARRYTQNLPEVIAGLRLGHSSTHPVEQAALGDLRSWCHRAIHLQCASGEDTLSLVTEGATEVVGIDISPAHIANAKECARALDAPATFHCCDVLDAPRELDGTADLIYTGRGAVYWIHDLTAWAGVVARLLRPGGQVLLYEDHPANWLFDMREPHPEYSGVDYFAHAERNWGWPEQYLGTVSANPAVKHERLWPLGEIVQALVDAGLRLTRLWESPEEFWPVFAHMDEETRRRLPMTFLVTARKDGGG